MGQMKRLMEAAEEKRSRAIGIAIQAGVLKCCEFHDEVFVGSKDVVEAYKRGNARFEKDSLGEAFDTRREMTDYIKEVVEDAAEECWCCAKIRDE